MLAADLLKLCFGISKTSIFADTRGAPREAIFRQFFAYLIYVEGNLPEKEAAKLLKRHAATMRHSARVIEDLREDPDIDKLVEMMGISMRGLSAARAAFEKMTAATPVKAPKAVWIAALRAAGAAVRRAEEAPPEAAVTLEDEVEVPLSPTERALKEHEEFKKLLKGRIGLQVGALDGDGKRTLKLTLHKSQDTVKEVMQLGRRVLVAAGFRIVMSDVWRAPKEGEASKTSGAYCAVWKVVEGVPAQAAKATSRAA